jgi:hypothetical protein
MAFLTLVPLALHSCLFFCAIDFEVLSTRQAGPMNSIKILLTTIKGVFKRIINNPIASAQINENTFQSIDIDNTRPMSCCFIKPMHSTASSQNHTNPPIQ